MTAHEDWLVRRWGLSEAVASVVQDLLAEEGRGSTALRLEPAKQAQIGSDGWGGAAFEDDSNSPLVLIRDGGDIFLQSRVLHESEAAIAKHLRLLALAAFTPPPSAEDLIAQLFPDAQGEQAQAARLALRSGLTLLTGGPGTGKTHTLARILALLVKAGHPPQKIYLAAPTGKAADRMKASISDSLDQAGLASEREVLLSVASSGKTLHSLLGYNPATGLCAAGPLPEGSTVIIDESSMVDVHMWRALCGRLPQDARLILVGDPNQLESVGQGAVFSELVRAAEQPPIAHALARLSQSRRFATESDIPRLAQAMEDANPEAAAQILETHRNGAAEAGVAWIPHSGGAFPVAAIPSRIHDGLAAIADAESPEQAIAAFGSVCILAAQRRFFVGSAAINAVMENHLTQTGRPIQHRPIIINRNDPATGLRNGAVGILSRSPSPRARFPMPGGALREFSPGALPDHSPAWAITIHRSQGSEYDHVLVILPREESPLATRELLYTAITRARKSVFVAGDLDTVKKAVQTSSSRVTLLRTVLRALENQ